MKGLLFAVMVAALGFGGYFYWKQRTAQTTQLAVVDKGPPAKPTRDRKKRRRRGALRVARNDTFVGAEPSMPAGGGAPSGGEAPVPGGASTTEVGPDDVLGGLSSPRPGAGSRADEAPEPAPIKLSASDLRTVARGDDLTEPTVTRLDLSDGTRELSQDEIDTRFRSKEDAILGCISRARPDEYTWIPGRVSVGFRIEKSGGVRGVRVEAPAILHKNGLYGCVKGVVGGLKFPASSGSQVVTYPFSLT
jgi:hypothetical protein